MPSRLCRIAGQAARRICLARPDTIVHLCVPQGDFPAAKMIDGLAGVDPQRRKRLMEVLDIDPAWRMHTVSDGQRRRVQLMLGLLHPFQVQFPRAMRSCSACWLQPTQVLHAPGSWQSLCLQTRTCLHDICPLV